MVVSVSDPTRCSCPFWVEHFTPCSTGSVVTVDVTLAARARAPVRSFLGARIFKFLFLSF